LLYCAVRHYAFILALVAVGVYVCVCVYLVGQRNNTKLLVFLNVLYNKSHMIDHHGTVHTQIADVVVGNQLRRIDWNLFNDELQTPRK
jgi:hypothetical protein